MGMCKSCGIVFNTNDMKDGFCVTCIENGGKQKELEITQNINNEKKSKEVVVTDIKMPFLSMVIFMIKWALASIPAIIILMILFTVFAGFLGIGAMSHRGY